MDLAAARFHQRQQAEVRKGFVHSVDTPGSAPSPRIERAVWHLCPKLMRSNAQLGQQKQFVLFSTRSRLDADLVLQKSMQLALSMHDLMLLPPLRGVLVAQAAGDEASLDVMGTLCSWWKSARAGSQTGVEGTIRQTRQHTASLFTSR